MINIRFSLVIYFILSSGVYVSLSLPIHPTPLSSLGVHNLLYKPLSCFENFALLGLIVAREIFDPGCSMEAAGACGI